MSDSFLHDIEFKNKITCDNNTLKKYSTDAESLVDEDKALNLIIGKI